MSLPVPVPGLVIRYSYLWLSESKQGREEGAKDRPCAIVAALRIGDDGEQRVLVLPITHRRPTDLAASVEIPLPVKRRLGLDDRPSWVVLSEWNEFVWPGPDLRPATLGDLASIAYGMLPPSLFAVIRERLLSLVGRKSARPVPRV